MSVLKAHTRAHTHTNTHKPARYRVLLLRATLQVQNIHCPDPYES